MSFDKWIKIQPCGHFKIFLDVFSSVWYGATSETVFNSARQQQKKCLDWAHLFPSVGSWQISCAYNAISVFLNHTSLGHRHWFSRTIYVIWTEARKAYKARKTDSLIRVQQQVYGKCLCVGILSLWKNAANPDVCYWLYKHHRTLYWWYIWFRFKF